MPRKSDRLPHRGTCQILHADASARPVAGPDVVQDVTTNGSIGGDWTRFDTLRDTLANR